MKTIFTVLKLFSQHFWTSSSLVRVFILYTSIALAMIHSFNFHLAIELIGLIKICLPSLFVVPAIKMTLLNDEVVTTFFEKLKNNDYISFKVVLVSHIMVVLITAIFLTLPTFVYEFNEILMNTSSEAELLFGFVKLINLLIFFVLIAFLAKIETNFNNMDIISTIFGTNFLLTFGLFSLDFLSDSIQKNYLGGYFGTNIFTKLSLNGLLNKQTAFGIPNDVLVTIILALFSFLMFFILMRYSNRKYLLNIMK